MSPTIPAKCKRGKISSSQSDLTKPPNFDGGGLNAAFAPADAKITAVASTGTSTKAGENEYHLTLHTPVAAPGGNWVLSSLQFWNSLSWVDLPHNNVLFHITPKRDLVFPTSAEVTVNLTQVQLLRSEVGRLRSKLQELRANLQASPTAPPSAAIRFLQDQVEQEISAVKATAARFHDLGNKPDNDPDAARIFFDDLALSYSQLLRGLQSQNSPRSVQPMLLPVLGSFAETKGKHLLETEATVRVVEINVLAYNLVADTAELTFDLEVNSVPEGAIVSYRRRGDPYKDHPNPTNTTIKGLPLAIWTVHFRKTDYREKDLEFNPFVERNRVISANLEK